MTRQYFTTDIARHIWDTKYRYRDGNVIHDRTVADTWQRIACALAGTERKDREHWEQHFCGVLEGFKFLPGGASRPVPGLITRSRCCTVL